MPPNHLRITLAEDLSVNGPTQLWVIPPKWCGSSARRNRANIERMISSDCVPGELGAWRGGRAPGSPAMYGGLAPEPDQGAAAPGDQWTHGPTTRQTVYIQPNNQVKLESTIDNLVHPNRVITKICNVLVEEGFLLIDSRQSICSEMIVNVALLITVWKTVNFSPVESPQSVISR